MSKNLNSNKMKRKILEALDKQGGGPAKFNKLVKRCSIPKSAIKEFRMLVEDLVFDGVIQYDKGKVLKKVTASIASDIGSIYFFRNGAAIVTTNQEKEYFIPPEESACALPGDDVRVQVTRKATPGSGKAPDARVTEVVKRHFHQLVGIISFEGDKITATPALAGFQTKVSLQNAKGAKEGDRVLVHIKEWNNPKELPEGEVTDVIGPIENPALDTISVMHSYHLPQEFPPDVIHAAEQQEIKQEDFAKRRDIRDLYTFTIDPKTAKDFDDAISLEPNEKGYKLYVHIADVSYFVEQGGIIDREARKRGTSVYLPDQVVPMIPFHLSNGLCSLNPGVDRFAFTVEMQMSPSGKMLHADFYESIIHSNARLTYFQALTALQSPEGSYFPHWKMNRDLVRRVKQAGELAMTIRMRRMSSGALEMDVPEVRFQITRNGRISGIETSEHDMSHQLIEECMLLANETVSHHLYRQHVEQLYRIHEPPDPESFADLELMFLAAGKKCSHLEKRENLVSFLQEIKDLPYAKAWYICVLKAMKKAIYSIKNAGHYGLNKKFYAHFTSPIRRYPDLVIHRQLKKLLLKESPAYSKGELIELGKHCSQRELIAKEAEREVIDLKKIRFFQQQLADGKPLSYEGTIIEVKNSGIVVDIDAVMTVGMVHISLLGKDFFNFDPKRKCLIGKRTGISYSIGMKLQVHIVKINTQKRFYDFAPSDLPKIVPPTTKQIENRKKKKKRIRKRKK